MTKAWTAAEEDTALAIMRRGGDVDEIAAALPHRTSRAVGIKARRLERVVDREAKVKRNLSDADLMEEWNRIRGDAKGRDVVTNDTIRLTAQQIGVSETRMRDAFLNSVGIV